MLADPAMNAMLLAHLRTADFFDVGHHPTAEFVANTAVRIAPCTDGTPNHHRSQASVRKAGAGRPSLLKRFAHGIWCDHA